MGRNRKPKRSQLETGWCAACNKFSGHRPTQCPRRPLAYKIEVISRGEYRPVQEEAASAEFLEFEVVRK